MTRTMQSGAPTPEETFGTWTKRIRDEREPKLSQAALAAMIGLDSTAITKIERGNRSIRLNEAVQIAQMLGVTLTSMLRPDQPDDLHQQLARLLETRRDQERRIEERRQLIEALNEGIKEVTLLIERTDATAS
jgi:transcriptional regulator with XRE-family HTH domain